MGPGTFGATLRTNDSATARGPIQERDGEDSYPALGTTLKVALVAVGAAGIAGWLVLALVHLGDRYNVGHVQGIWMALARYANEGTLYPPLIDGRTVRRNPLDAAADRRERRGESRDW